MRFTVDGPHSRTGVSVGACVYVCCVQVGFQGSDERQSKRSAGKQSKLLATEPFP